MCIVFDYEREKKESSRGHDFDENRKDGDDNDPQEELVSFVGPRAMTASTACTLGHVLHVHVLYDFCVFGW